ncbi:hypothetical protein KDW43_21110, partial [Burkholderia vietnamiensis]|nr:hypothetical protein [Burkholderia vietnamiensis]
CHPCVAALRLPGRMAVEQVARWPWNAWPDESGLGGRMAWNPHPSEQNGMVKDFSDRHHEVKWFPSETTKIENLY